MNPPAPIGPGRTPTRATNEGSGVPTPMIGPKIRPARRAPMTLLTAVLASMVTGCGQTYIDDRATATTAAAITTTTSTLPPVPADASVDDLVDRLAAAMAGLSEAIVDDDDPVAKVNRVNEIWMVLQPKLPKNSVDENNLQTAIDLANNGVRAKHPADADKGYRIVNAIINAR